ncbi:aldolase [Kitasatospora sp. MMS16-BH015]|uniref:HpcH/HpaI aldolase/citrate lyase family protein n=1 Tax=Kitasatospora sp. MMS16-BH015 TaxID=2018025 RepID=UPI000CA0FBA9|nr:CoA ester lyase [Kitasatospora sp. MMS16-BH015]AUG80587.1 aldolase [Kitasatospora sp. MMS16-BH015]
MKYTRYCRSLLSTPATAVERYAKSHQSGADIAMVDLEDSVPPTRKEEARRLAEEFFALPSAKLARSAVRINSLAGPEGLRDLLAVGRYRVKPDLVLIPMAESARDVQIAAGALGADCPDTEFLAVLETPVGIERAPEVAAAGGRLRGVVFGSADYAFAVGAGLSWEALAYARARVVCAARAAGVEAMDSPLFEVADLAALRHEAGLARELGFSGKIAIHPSQLPLINQTFTPDEALLDRARRVVAAGRETGCAVTVVDGVMVGMPFFEASRRLVDEYGPGPEPTAAP